MLCPDGTVIVKGTGNAVALLLWRLTAVPSAGAFPLMVTLSVANAPDAKLDGVIDTKLSDRAVEEGVTVTVALWLLLL